MAAAVALVGGKRDHTERKRRSRALETGCHLWRSLRAGSQRFVVSDQRTVPQIVMTVRLPSSTHATTLRTAKPLHHARLGCEMEELS